MENVLTSFFSESWSADWGDNKVNKGNDDIVLETRASSLARPPAVLLTGDAWHDYISLEPPVMMGKCHFLSCVLFCCAQGLTVAASPEKPEKPEVHAVLEQQICLISKWANTCLALCHKNKVRRNIWIWLEVLRKQVNWWWTAKEQQKHGVHHALPDLALPAQSVPHRQGHRGKFFPCFSIEIFKLQMFPFPVTTLGWPFLHKSHGHLDHLSWGYRSLQGKETQ